MLPLISEVIRVSATAVSTGEKELDFYPGVLMCPQDRRGFSSESIYLLTASTQSVLTITKPEDTLDGPNEVRSVRRD